jgi:hypothetical protein
MSPWVTIPSTSEARRDAAREDLRGLLEVIGCLARLIATGPVTERERRLATAVRLAAERAQRAARRLGG